jgi:hypothetical protein
MKFKDLNRRRCSHCHDTSFYCRHVDVIDRRKGSIWKRYLFICGLFNDVASSSDYVTSADEVFMRWKGYGRKLSWPDFRCYSSICLGET